MYEFLEDFEKRMKWVGIVESIVNRKGKKREIEELFKGNQLTNLIFSTLIFIMEKTLEEDNDCDIGHLNEFITNLLKNYYNIYLNQNRYMIITEYIVKEILQNGGELYEYNVTNYKEKKEESIYIRLVADRLVEKEKNRKIVYTLTDQGYDFIFKTREVDEELKMTVEQFKLREYVKRNKFSNAVQQSMELVTLIRQKKKDIEQFYQMLNENINNISIDEYKNLMDNTFEILREENETMDDISYMIKNAKQSFLKEKEKIYEKLELQEAVKDIGKIIDNIDTVIKEQRELINRRKELGDFYKETLMESIEYQLEKRYSIEEKILKKLENKQNDLSRLLKLINPLFRPKYKKKLLSLDSIYCKQLIYKEKEEVKRNEIQIEENEKENEIKKRIQKEKRMRFKNITRDILILIYNYKSITLKKIIENFKAEDKYQNYAKDRELFMISMYLYNKKIIDIKEFLESDEEFIISFIEEYNIYYIMYDLLDELKFLNKMERIYINKVDEIITDSIIDSFDKTKVEEIKITNLIFEVKR